MLKWEIKKILKEKTNIIVLILMIILFLQISFVKPILETQNEYYDEVKNEYIIDHRPIDVIANEKLKEKVNQINELKTMKKDKSTKELNKISSEKLKKDSGNEYEDVSFYKVFSQRSDFGFSIVIMMIIIVMISSNLYIDERLSNVAPIIISSKNKNKVLYSKLAIAILLLILLYAVYLLGTYFITYMQYKKPLNGGLQAYRISDLAIFIKPLTINGYIVSQALTTTLMLSGISLLSLLSSFISDNSVKAIGLSVSFIALGKVLTLFKFLPKTLLILLSLGNYVDVTMGMSKISGFYNGSIDILSRSFDVSNLCIFMYVLIILASILGNIYCIKKYLNS